MDKTTISVTDFFLSGGENVRIEHLHKLISSYLSSRSASADSACSPRGHKHNQSSQLPSTARAKSE